MNISIQPDIPNTLMRHATIVLLIGLSILGTSITPKKAYAITIGEMLNERHSKHEAQAEARRQRMDEARSRSAEKSRTQENQFFTGQLRWLMGTSIADDVAVRALQHPVPPIAQWPLVAEEPYDGYLPRPSRVNRIGREEINNVQTHWLICKFGTTPENPVQIMYWRAGQRIKLSSDSVQSYSGSHYADVEMEHCPATLGEALVNYGTDFASDYQAALGRAREKQALWERNRPETQAKHVAEKHNVATQAGLRFASQYYGDFDVSNTQAANEIRLLFDVQALTNPQDTHWYRASPKVTQDSLPAAVATEIEKLHGSKQKLLYCTYSGESLDSQFSNRWIGVNFWYKSRPNKISPALADWIESANLSLVDAAVDDCPKYAGQSFALAQGMIGERATKLASRSRLAALTASEPELAQCARVLSVAIDSSQPKPERREPTSLEMCAATYKHINEGLASWNNVPAAVERFAGKEARKLPDILKAFHGGDKSASLTAFRKTTCRKTGTDHLCSYYIGLVSKSATGFVIGTGPGHAIPISFPGEAGFKWDGQAWAFISNSSSSSGGYADSPSHPIDAVNPWEGLADYSKKEAEDRRQREQTERDRKIERDGWRIKNP